MTAVGTVRRRAILGAAVALAAPSTLRTQNYPARPVRVVNAYSAGGTADVVCRVLCAGLSMRMGQTFTVDNRPGAAGTVAAQIGAHAAPDGYTLLYDATGQSVNPSLFGSRLPGGPLGIGPFAGRQAEVFPEWKRQILALAALPNVVVKLGGLTMYVTGFDFHRRPQPPGSAELAEAWRPYIETCIEAFGAARCMFESNFPVDKGMCSYPILWNALKRLAAGAGADEKTALFSGTAMRVYRLTRLPDGLAIDLASR